MISIGKFLFRWRNGLFPVIVLLLFASASPVTKIAGSEYLELIGDIVAIALIIIGVTIRLMVIGFVRVPRTGKHKEVNANELFTKGMFGICRNPLYLGNLTIYLGVFILHGAWPVIVVGFLLFLFIYYAIMFNEESFLKAEFGDAYTKYCKTTPRLIPRLSNWKTATEGLNRDWKQAFSTEDNIISQAIFVIGLVFWYEHASKNGSYAMPVISMVILGFGVSYVLAMWVYKRNMANRHK